MLTRCKNASKIICFKLRLDELTDGEMRIEDRGTGMTFEICGAEYRPKCVTESATTY